MYKTKHYLLQENRNILREEKNFVIWYYDIFLILKNACLSQFNLESYKLFFERFSLLFIEFIKLVIKMKKLKSNIGWLIDRSPYNREYFMKRYGKSRNTISNWCTGKSYPGVPELFDMAKLLKVKVDDLYEFVEDEVE